MLTAYKKKLIIFFPLIYFISFYAGFVHASPETIKSIKEYHGNFLTTIKGISDSQPPYISVIRSKDGVTYLFNKFRKIRNLITHNKALHLERELLKNDFLSRMLIAVLSHPTDNYQIGKVQILKLENEQKIEVNVSYFHRSREYSIPPFKSVFYEFYVVKKSELPVVLNAQHIKKKTAKSGENSSTTIYGTLQNWESHGKNLALVNKHKRKKRVYYIKGVLQEELRQYIGKFMALKGEVITDSESVYEADLFVKKIVKVY